MSFERSFPSLHDAETLCVGLDEDDGTNLYHQQDISFHCLDRQKVKELLLKFDCSMLQRVDDRDYIHSSDYQLLIISLLKELGLEE